MIEFEEVMRREQCRVEALKGRQALLQDQIESTEAYMRWCVEQYVQSQLPKGSPDER